MPEPSNASKVVALTAVAALTLAACTAAGTDGAPPPSPGPDEQGEATTISPAWTLAGYTPVSAVRAADDGFVLYALDGEGRLEAIGVDAETGEVRWAYPATPSYIIAGVGLSMTVGEGLAVFLSPYQGDDPSRGRARIVAVEPATGEIRWVQLTLRSVTAHPSLCHDDEYVCAIGRRSGGDLVWAVFDLNGEEQSLTPVDDSRRISSNLFPANDATDLRRIEADGTVGWQRPIRELFGGADVHPSNGWHIRNQDGRYVGELGIEWTEEEDGSFWLELGDRVVAAFDERTGEPLWHEPGTHPCVGIAFNFDHPVRCRSTGRYHVDEEGVERRLEGQVTIEGFDPGSGETTWSWKVGQVLGLLFTDESVRRIDDVTYVVTTADGHKVLDVSTGERQRVAEPPPTWCSTREYYEPAVEIVNRPSNQLLVTERWPCADGGEPLEQPVTVPKFAGARAGDVFAWIAQGQLHAVRLGD